jgi:uncharacterized protein YkwD
MRRMTAAAAALALMATLGVAQGGAERAEAQGLEVGGSGNAYYLNDQFTTTANIQFSFGLATDQVYFGDWDGDGVDTPMHRRGATFSLSNANASVAPQQTFTYGRSDDQVLVGDWDGDGVDTLAVRRDTIFHIRNSLSDGSADAVVAYGRSGDTVLVGDWDGTRTDTFAVRRGAQYHVRNTMTSGPADVIVQYGREDDDVLVGDWDGNRTDSFAVRRDATYFIANHIRPGEADVTVVYGRVDDVAFSGDWNGDGADTLGVRRVAAPPPVPADPVNCTGTGANQVDPAVCQTMETARADMLVLVNAERAERDLPALRLDPCLDEVAQHWAESMAWLRTTGSAHNPDLTADMRACSMRSWGENVARDRVPTPDEERIMERWLASTGHYNNLMTSSRTLIGVGVAPSSDGHWYYVLDFGQK